MASFAVNNNGNDCAGKVDVVVEAYVTPSACPSISRAWIRATRSRMRARTHTRTRACAHPRARTREREERARAHTHAHTRGDGRECAGGVRGRVTYTGRAHTYRSSLSIILLMWNSLTPLTPFPLDSPRRPRSAPLGRRDASYRARYRRYIATLIPLPLFSSSTTSPHSRRRETTPQDRKILALTSPIIPDTLSEKLSVEKKIIEHRNFLMYRDRSILYLKNCEAR